MSSLLLRRVRLVPVAGVAVPPGEVDVRLSTSHVAEVGENLKPVAGQAVLDCDGRYVMPGLWDQHVHMTQWALTAQRLDLAGARDARQALDIVSAHVAALAPSWRGVVQGWGHRSATWPEQPSVALLDAVSGDHPVVLVSGDAHHAWINSRGLELLGLAPREGVVEELEWFDAFARIGELPGAEQQQRAAMEAALDEAAARGVVGIVDMEFGLGPTDWAHRRHFDALTAMRVRSAVYPDRLDEVLAAGLRTGDRLDDDGLITMGPLKMISDGSLNTRTAWCHQPYLASPGLAHPHGVPNYTPEQLLSLVTRAKAAGLEVAIHAIGDAAMKQAIDVLTTTGAHGSIEHAQLVDLADVPRLAALPVRASVQPAHLLDDREVTSRLWADRSDRCFTFASFARAGVPLALGSDAPVARLDPWLAMAAAVWRGDESSIAAWNQSEAISVEQALAASVDGQGSVAVGSRADLVLLDDDPLARDLVLPTDDSGERARAVAARLRSLTVAATVVGGQVTHASGAVLPAGWT